MNVLSLFDGISCGRIALDRAGIKYDNYYASEINENAMKVALHNYPDTIPLGDVTKVLGYGLPKIDLLIGGSCCQNLSVAMKNRDGLKGEKSKLFWEFVRLLDETKPTYFLLENVASMAKEDKDVISQALGVQPICINSDLVSGALRKRLYWTNIPNVIPPRDKGIKLQDVLTEGYTDRTKARALLASDSRPLATKERMLHRYRDTGFTTIVFKDSNMETKDIRYLNQLELERLMTLPENYTSILTRNQAAECIGNSWTCDVISHIFSFLPGEYK